MSIRGHIQIKKKITTGLSLLWFFAIVLYPGCGGNNETKAPATDAVTSIKGAENKLARSGQPYLIFDLNKKRLSIMLFGADVRDLEFACDSLHMGDWKSGLALKTTADDSVKSVHLSSARAVVGERELSIISEVSQVRQEEIQRYMPEEMTIYLSQGYRVRIKTDVEGNPVSRFANLGNWIKETGDAVLGGRVIELKMSGPDAMAFYGVALESPKVLYRF
jgi:hypothetical protein